MSVLNYLKLYGTDENSSSESADEDLYEFGGGKEQFKDTHGAAVGAPATAIEDEVRANEDPCELPEPISESFQNDPADSDGSFFDGQQSSGGTPKPRKRTKKEIQKEDSAKKRRMSHAIKLVDCKCRKGCLTKVGKEDRTRIHERFWNLDSSGQDAFFRETVQLAPLKRRVKDRFILEEPRKRKSYIFHLMVDDIERVEVCRKFFLNTIGYNENCGNLVYRSVDGDDDGNRRLSQRGKHIRDQTKKDAVKAHINSFNPCISHYRREHAPNRLYLPSDLTEKAMFEHYLKTENVPMVSYPFYCRVLKNMNISMVKLGHEECELCTSSTQHQEQSGHSELATDEGSSDQPKSCLVCEKYAMHLRSAATSREGYRKDGEEVKPGRVVLAVDLQKVIQLPRLDGYKSIVFSQRLLAYNETFAPVGKYAKKLPVITCLWDESTAGRHAHDITSCFHRVIERFSDVDEIIFWLDNCSAQNKNWNLFQHMILLLNSTAVSVRKMCFKFFETGHTFMAADSVHAAIEKSMRNSEPAQTFPDFSRIVQKAKQNMEVINMSHSDFFSTTVNTSQYVINQCKPRPYIENIKYTVFKKGSLELLYSNAADGSEPMNRCTLFTKKQMKQIQSEGFVLEKTLKRQASPKGITKDRKAALLKVILPLVNDESKPYWTDLPEQK